MNKMKRHLRNRGMFYVLTYGDNSALGFFRRNGFTQDVTLDRYVTNCILYPCTKPLLTIINGLRVTTEKYGGVV
jgi:hypothetical protein